MSARLSRESSRAYPIDYGHTSISIRARCPFVHNDNLYDEFIKGNGDNYL